MNRYFIIICLISFYNSWCVGQIVRQQHYDNVKMDVLSIANISNNELINIAGVQEEKVVSADLNVKNKSLSKNNFTFQNKIPFVADFITQVSKDQFLIAKQSKKGFQYGIIAKDGKPVWNKVFNFNTTAKINAACRVKSGGIVVVGRDNNQMFAARLDHKGKIIWQERFGGNGELLDVVETRNGSFLMVGYIDLFSSGETDYFITQLTNTGKNEWEKVLGEPEHLNEKARLVSIAANQQIIVAGSRGNNIWMLQLTKNQEVTWEEEIKEKGFKLEPTAIYSQNNGTTFLAASASSSTQDKHLYMVQLNSYLMSSGTDLVGKFYLEPLDGNRKRPLSVNYKASNRYYQVTSDTRSFKELQLLGDYPNGYYVHVLGVNNKGQVTILSSKSSNASLRQMTTLIDLEKHQYLILLVCNYEVNVKELKKRLQYKEDMIEGLLEVLGKHVMSRDKISYKPYEITAHTPLDEEGIVPFFIKLK